MPPNEQALLWMALRDRMKGDWHDLTWQEKRAGMLANACPPAHLPPSHYKHSPPILHHLLSHIYLQHPKTNLLSPSQ